MYFTTFENDFMKRQTHHKVWSYSFEDEKEELIHHRDPEQMLTINN